MRLEQGGFGSLGPQDPSTSRARPADAERDRGEPACLSVVIAAAQALGRAVVEESSATPVRTRASRASKRRNLHSSGSAHPADDRAPRLSLQQGQVVPRIEDHTSRS